MPESNMRRTLLNWKEAMITRSAGCRKVVAAAAMFAPSHGLGATAEQQRHIEALGVFVEYPQVKLHQVPANDRVGVEGGDPLVEAFKQLGAGVAVVELEVDRVGFIGWAEHVHLALAAAFEWQDQNFKIMVIIFTIFYLRITY